MSTAMLPSAPLFERQDPMQKRYHQSLFEQQGPCGLDHEAMFGAENKDNILDPIIEYMLDDSDGGYMPLK